MAAATSGGSITPKLRAYSGNACTYIAQSTRSRELRTGLTLRPGALQGAPALAVRIDVELFDNAEDRVLNARIVPVEDLDHFVMRDRRHAAGAFEPDVVIGDQRDVHVAHLQFASQVGFGILGHVDHFPAQPRKPPRLGTSGKTRPLNDDDRAPLVRVDAQGAQRLD